MLFHLDTEIDNTFPDFHMVALNEKNRAMVYAAESGHIDIVQFLHKKEKDINATTNKNIDIGIIKPIKRNNIFLIF